jgi:hypothetical protein
MDAAGMIIWHWLLQLRGVVLGEVLRMLRNK